ncbi:MAG: hypothetical protein RJB38_2351 [Pseudomonadota bacterium]|jgi:16S rRNA (uracil1498-N3)-methyltransferase
MSSKKALRIPRVLCTALPTPQKPTLIEPDEAAHLHQALRLKSGSPIIAIDGRGHAVPARYLVQDRKALAEVEPGASHESREQDQEGGNLVLEIAVLKGDAMSWLIEKCVELGVRRIVPLLTDHAVVQLDKKGLDHFVDRWQRIADQALKQCERLHRLQIDSPRTLDDLLRQALPSDQTRAVALEPKSRVGFESPAELTESLWKGTSESHVLIGPEGGWSSREIQLFLAENRAKKLRALHLGSLVLRAETAGLLVASCAVAQHARASSSRE